MTAKAFPPAFRAALGALTKDTSLRISSVEQSWDFAIGRGILKRLTSFLRKHSTALGQYRFGFELTQNDDTGRPMLTASQIITDNTSGPVLIELGKDLRVLATKPLPCDGQEATEPDYSFASRDTVVALYDGPTTLVIFANGYTVRVINLRSPAASAPRRRDYYSAKEYKLAIREHYREKIRYNWQETDHWEKRDERKLRAVLGKRKTEGIFHWSLFGWLDQMLDNTIVRSQPRDKSSDEPDIIIISTDPGGGGPFLAELKWLGWNGLTKHRRSWLTKGLKQLGEYLDKQSQIREATLVVYDGRSKQDFEKLERLEIPEEGCRIIAKCDGPKVHARGSCMVFFLENETSSQQ
jgi:hypothetical protein